MAKNKPLKFALRIDLQCGVCGALIHQGEGFPAEESLSHKFCPCCGAALERFCLRCQRKAEMFFEEWWPRDEECLRTYFPARRCSRCNSILDSPGGSQIHRDEKYQN